MEGKFCYGRTHSLRNSAREAQAREWRTKPIHYEKEFRIAPGQYSFTLASDFGKTTMPLAVESWTPGKLALSSIVLSRAIHPAADLGLGPLTVRRTPLVAEGTQVVPSGSTQFRRAEAPHSCQRRQPFAASEFPVAIRFTHHGFVSARNYSIRFDWYYGYAHYEFRP
jgi:hypothetical protein